MEAAMTDTRTFNTPFEAGLRALFILAAAGRRSFDSQRLVYLDYVLVHSGDLHGPANLHPRTPSQKGELLVRRELVQEGLALMRSRELIERRFAATGIVYAATPAGRHVASEFASGYAQLLKERAAWLITSFADATDQALANLLKPHAAAWEDELVVDHRADSDGDVGHG
jgi:hypothetical protein